MIALRLGAVVFAAVTVACAANHEVIAVANPTAIEEFKARIHFEAAPAPLPPGEGMVLDWPDPLDLQYFQKGSWRLSNHSAWAQLPGFAMQSWLLQNGEAVIEVEVGVSSDGGALARDQLIGAASMTMYSEIPYQRGPNELGDLSITGPESSEQQTLIWVFRNVFVKLYREDGDSLLDLARELQAFLARGSVEALAARVPRIGRFEISSERVAVGESLEAKVTLTPEAVGSLVRIYDPDLHLLPVAGREGHVTLRGKTAGSTSVVAMVVDRATLLSSFERLPVEVVEP